MIYIEAGFEAIVDLPEPNGLHLGRTRVEGRSLSRLKSLSRLWILDLNHSKVAEEGFIALSGATSLRILSLDGVHLTPDGRPLLRALPRVNRLNLTGSGFLDEEIDAPVKSTPGLKEMRK